MDEKFTGFNPGFKFYVSMAISAMWMMAEIAIKALYFYYLHLQDETQEHYIHMKTLQPLSITFLLFLHQQQFLIWNLHPLIDKEQINEYFK